MPRDIHKKEPSSLVATRSVGADSTISLERSATIASAALSAPARSHEGARYTFLAPIGQGAEGRVVACMDKELGRRVAVKIPLSSDERPVRQFLSEARLTARLEHPNIVPIYDLGILSSGDPFYAMREVERRSLRDVLKDDVWSRVRLLNAFTQIARALGHAHQRGVLHGDVKPSNILVGGSGQVYLADWGLARIRDERPFDPMGPPISLPGLDVGTLGYMAPEIFKQETVSAATDLFALGVVLYQILAKKKPFLGDDAGEVIAATCFEDPVPPRSVDAECPLLLEALCISLLAKDPVDRPENADVVIDAVEAFLAGDRENALRRQKAASLCERASEAALRHRELDEASRQAKASAAETARWIKPWEGLERKRLVWGEQDRAAHAERESAQSLARAIELFIQALGHDARNRDAHAGLGALYWSRARRAEEDGREPSRVYFEALAGEHDVDGMYARLMSSRASLAVTSRPSGASVTVQQYESVDRRLVLGDSERLGTTPLNVELAPGSYLLTIQAPGFRPTRCPVFLRRGDSREVGARLFAEGAFADAFVQVSGGAALVGGDPDAMKPIQSMTVDVSDFAIAVSPVTMRQYCDFLNDLSEEDALLRAPQDRMEGLIVRKTARGWEPLDVIIEGDARTMFPIEDGHLWNVPASLVSWFDSRAYCQWLSGRGARTFRLATELEWEKAARGVDGRIFPWGDDFDATFCKMRDSRPFAQQPEPVGTFPVDESPYGVRDMAGGYREWVGDIHEELDDAAAWSEDEPCTSQGRAESSFRMVRSGSWRTSSVYCRAASRGPIYSAMRGVALTFRLAHSLD